jgi:hypothetical protein
MERINVINLVFFLLQSTPRPRDTISAQLPRNSFSSRLSAASRQRKYLIFNPILLTLFRESLLTCNSSSTNKIFFPLLYNTDMAI